MVDDDVISVDFISERILKRKSNYPRSKIFCYSLVINRDIYFLQLHINKVSLIERH